MVVSVVTNGVSDDCNSVVVNGNQVFLRVTRLEHAYAFHYSHDATNWRLVRYFALLTEDAVSAGLSSQSPTGEGCHVRFSEIRYATEVVRDIRSGA
jgi:regulation of enolase protein 1 (concanavalin A-like superfamily)